MSDLKKIVYYSPIFAALAVMRKNSKIRQNRKICLNEITHLQLLIFGKRDFLTTGVFAGDIPSFTYG